MDLEREKTLRALLIRQVGRVKAGRIMDSLHVALSEICCNSIIFADNPDGEFITVVPLSEN